MESNPHHLTTVEALTKRHRELKTMLYKTRLCGYHFRQRCLHFKEHCYHAHGLTELRRHLPSGELVALRAELFNVKEALKRMNMRVLYNGKSKRFEMYKKREIELLKAIRSGQIVQLDCAADDDEEDGEDEGDNDIADPVAKAEASLRKSVGNLNLEDCRFVESIRHPSELYKFDMNKAIDSDDEDNLVKRRSRTRHDLMIVRPWQNEIMSDFMKVLFKESGETVLFRQTINNKYNEAGVPITW